MWTHNNPFLEGIASLNYSGKRSSFHLADLLHLQACGASFLSADHFGHRTIPNHDGLVARLRPRIISDRDTSVGRYRSSLVDNRLPVPCGSQTSSALGPLKAFCATKQVQRLVSSDFSNSKEHNKGHNNNDRRENVLPDTNLKFGINRILSEDFGKTNDEDNGKSIT